MFYRFVRHLVVKRLLYKVFAYRHSAAKDASQVAGWVLCCIKNPAAGLIGWFARVVVFVLPGKYRCFYNTGICSVRNLPVIWLTRKIFLMYNLRKPIVHCF